MARDNAPPPVTGKQAVTAAMIAAAVAVAAPIATKWEGYAPKVYRDPAGIPTWCYGETEAKLSQDPSYIYSKDQCATLLRRRMQRDYAPVIARCLPEIGPNRFIFGALVDASYNAGPMAVCRSPMAASIKAGELARACEALPHWYITARKRVNGKRVGRPFLLNGLVNRRKDERRVCLTGAG